MRQPSLAAVMDIPQQNELMLLLLHAVASAVFLILGYEISQRKTWPYIFFADPNLNYAAA